MSGLLKVWKDLALEELDAGGVVGGLGEVEDAVAQTGVGHAAQYTFSPITLPRGV